MKKLVDSEFDQHKVEESKPLPEGEKPNVEPVKKSPNNTALIVTIVLLIIAVVGYMIYNHIQSKKENGN